VLHYYNPRYPLGRLRQEDCEFEVSLGNIARPNLGLKKKKKNEKKEKKLGLVRLSKEEYVYQRFGWIDAQPTLRTFRKKWSKWNVKA
jgi:hypothetical protein